MKILCYKNSNEINFDYLLNVISKTKHKIGYASGEIDSKALTEFNPDLIIHNIPDATEFPVKTKAVSININDTDHDKSFSFTNPLSKQYVGECVFLRDLNISDNDIQKFQSDVIYIGSPAVFKDLLCFLTDAKSKINFKFFSHEPHNINGYCGVCNSLDYGKYYKYAKASIAIDKDKNRIRDIIISDGNPVLFDGANTSECISKIQKAISEDARYTLVDFNKDHILKNHTIFDRAIQIFKNVGLTSIAEDIRKQKNIEIGNRK